MPERDSKRWTCSATVRDKKGNLKFPNDPGAGVGILLSARMAKKVLSHGNNNSERLCWVRLRGPSCNMYIICVYMPHRGRTKPCQQDTYKELRQSIKKVPKGDCVIIMGDLNEQLPATIKNCTGRYTTSADGSANAETAIRFMCG